MSRYWIVKWWAWYVVKEAWKFAVGDARDQRERGWMSVRVDTTTRERPILFSGAMVRAILAGRKTQTRRVMKHQPPKHAIEVRVLRAGSAAFRPIFPSIVLAGGGGWQGLENCPYGVPGDLLWVRETWAKESEGTGCPDDDCGTLYRATDPGWDDNQTGLRWLPSVYMPHDRSRITLRVTSVRVERVRDVSAADAMAEGVREFTKDGTLMKYGLDGWEWQSMPRSPVEAFERLWDSINATRKGGTYAWAENPWVWVVEFERVGGSA